MIEITIPGNPIAKARPKFARRGKFVTTYNPQESLEGKWITLAQKYLPAEPLRGALMLVVFFYMPIPKSASKKQQSAMINGFIHHTKRPDLDNCLKFCKDCLNGMAWIDDSQVVDVKAAKTYAEIPRTQIFIKPLEQPVPRAQKGSVKCRL